MLNNDITYLHEQPLIAELLRGTVRAVHLLENDGFRFIHQHSGQGPTVYSPTELDQLSPLLAPALAYMCSQTVTPAAMARMLQHTIRLWQMDVRHYHYEKEVHCWSVWRQFEPDADGTITLQQDLYPGSAVHGAPVISGSATTTQATKTWSEWHRRYPELQHIHDAALGLGMEPAQVAAICHQQMYYPDTPVQAILPDLSTMTIA